MLNVIKDYLISLGFDVDKNSFDEANKSVETLDKIVNRFKKNFADNKLLQQAAENLDKTLDKISNSLTSFVTSTEGLILGAIAAIGVAIAALAAIIAAATYKFMSTMAKADLQVQVFARRLMTTVDNARSLQAVMDAMGVKSLDELNDIAFNPELQKRFLDLRKLTSEMQVGAGVEKGLKNIRDLNFEFTKLGLIFNYFWTNLAGKLGQVLEGPLKELQGWFASAERFAMTALPSLGDILSHIAGILIKIVSIGIKLATIWTKIPGLGAAAEDVLTNILDLLDGSLQVVDSVLGLFDRALSKLRFKTGDDEHHDKYGTQKDIFSTIAVYIKKIFDLLNSVWNSITSFFRPIMDFVRDKLKPITDFFGGTPAQAATIPPVGPMGPVPATQKGSYKHLFYNPGVKTSPWIEEFLRNLDGKLGTKYSITSGVDSRSGGSLHPAGLAFDTGLGGKSDAQILELMKGVLATPGLKIANLELQPSHYARIIRELNRQGVQTEGKVSNQITKDWTGPHLHTSLVPPVNINVHGVHNPREVSRIIEQHERNRISMSMRNQQGPYA